MRSVRARLFVGLSVLVVGTNIGFGLLSYRRAAEEATELQDAVLHQVDRFAVQAGGTGLDLTDAQDEPEFRVVIEVLGAVRPGSPLAGVPGDTPDGISTVGKGGARWRLLVRTRPDGKRVGIAQSTASRDERVRDTLLQTLVPLLLLLPCLLLLVGVIIQASFRPLSVLAGRLDARPPDDLRTLPAEGVAVELLPFIDAINRLLGRVGEMVEHRRRFVADAAHELRTPVTALTVQAENLSRLGMPAEALPRLAALQGGIRRLGHLLEQLLSLARYEEGTAAATAGTSLDAAARDVVAAMIPVADERSTDLGFSRIEPADVRADPTSLRVMIRNLLDNALRHTPVGGRIDVEVYAEAGFAVFRATDDGPGIAADEIDRILDPFVRGGHVETEGTGLGLSIVRSVAETCGGSVVLANRTDRPHGLVATVRIPAASEARSDSAVIP
ncbi:two-component system, OmpR family, sensor kinase [Methylobacterium sp. UNC378MF]|uniref:histidine kinase n=1 Tax=Methylobacterium oryzae TaxID=334852 RepID=A0ABU7TMM2_9HYPH|nr:ATP-binding protein [Methylobacterium sp. UNC378MF]SDA17279.1 two-component system, OmpR family, sensor kinase [Methylobacterium sp. UNC378MF]